MHPYGFFSDQTYDFYDGLNLIYGENEAGKSTVFSALKTVLYGFNPASREKHPYIHWTLDHAKISAKIYSEGELFKVERRLISAPQCVISALDKNLVYTSRNDVFSEANVYSPQLFSAVFHLKTTELEGVAASGWKHIEGKFSDIYHIPYLNSVSDVMDEMRRESLKLWRSDRRGNPEILALEKTLYDLEQEIHVLEEQEDVLRMKEDEHKLLTEELRHLQAQLAKVDDETQRYKSYQSVYNYYLEMNHIESQLDFKAKEALADLEKIEASLIDKENKYHELIQIKLRNSQKQALLGKKELEHLYHKISDKPLNLETYQYMKELDIESLYALDAKKIYFYLMTGFGLSVLSLFCLLSLLLKVNVFYWKAISIALGAILFFLSVFFYNKHRKLKLQVVRIFKDKDFFIRAFLKDSKMILSVLDQIKVHMVYIEQLNQSVDSEPLNLYQLEIADLKNQIIMQKEKIASWGEGVFSKGFQYCVDMKEKYAEFCKVKDTFTLLNREWRLSHDLLNFMQKTDGIHLQSKHLEIENQIHEKKEEIGTLLLDIERLKTYDKKETLIEKRDDLKSKLLTLRHRKDILSVAIALLNKAQNSYKMSHQPELLKIASHYFCKITDGKYKVIYFDDENQKLSIYIETNDGLIPYKESFSQGTRQQLFFALRLAYMDILDPEKKMPLIIDDVLSVWDQKRMREAVHLIKEISKTRQVFFFTCNPLTVEMFHGEGLISL